MESSRFAFSLQLATVAASDRCQYRQMGHTVGRWVIEVSEVDPQPPLSFAVESEDSAQRASQVRQRLQVGYDWLHLFLIRIDEGNSWLERRT